MASFKDSLHGSPLPKIGLAGVIVAAFGAVGFMAVNSSACNSNNYGPQVTQQDISKTADAAIKSINADNTLTPLQKQTEINYYKGMAAKAQGTPAASPAPGPPPGVPGGPPK